MQRRLDLRRRVLTPSECDSLGGVAGMTEQEEVLLRFSVKEAVYKAAHPLLHRPLAFKDVSAEYASCCGPVANCVEVERDPIVVSWRLAKKLAVTLVLHVAGRLKVTGRSNWSTCRQLWQPVHTPVFRLCCLVMGNRIFSRKFG